MHFFSTIRSSLLYHYSLALFLSIKQSGRLLEGLRHEPVAAAFVVHVHFIIVEVQAVSFITFARDRTRRPVETGNIGITVVAKQTVVVIAQRREEEVIINLAIIWPAMCKSSTLSHESSTQIIIIGAHKF